MAVPIHNSDFNKNTLKNRLSTTIRTIKLLFFLTAFISIFVLFKHVMPYCFNLIFSIVPRFWFLLRALSTPPYLYIIVNGIIITIAVSSRLAQKLTEKNDEETVMEKREQQKASPEDPWTENSSLTVDPVYNSPVSDEKSAETVRFSGGDLSVESMLENSCVTEHPGYNLPVIGLGKPAVTVRFGSLKGEKQMPGNNRKSVKPSPDRRALGVAREKKYDTLDSTWKKITEGRASPLNRHLKKCETWESAPRLLRRAEAEPELLSDRREFKKSETFSYTSPASSLSASSTQVPGRESSWSRDELNRRVEAFIKKFGDNIRLQRQESEMHYVEMMNRGSN